MKKVVVFLCCASGIFFSCRPYLSPNSPLGVPNGDFEMWNAGPILTDWVTNSNPFSTSPINTYIVQQDSTPYHGKYAAKLVYNGVYPAEAENKFAVLTHPTYVEFFTKINLYGPDTVSVRVDVFKNDVIVDSGYWNCASSLSNYTQVQIPITNHSMQADSVLISIRGGKNFGLQGQKTEFWVDYMDMH
jgi:hypothetical protein